MEYFMEVVPKHCRTTLLFLVKVGGNVHIRLHRHAGQNFLHVLRRLQTNVQSRGGQHSPVPDSFPFTFLPPACTYPPPKHTLGYPRPGTNLFIDLLTDYTLRWNFCLCVISHLTKLCLEFNDNSIFFTSWDMCIFPLVFLHLVMRFWKIKCIIGMYPH